MEVSFTGGVAELKRCPGHIAPLGKGEEEGSQEKKMRNVATAVLGAGCIANSTNTNSRPKRLFIFLVIIS